MRGMCWGKSKGRRRSLGRRRDWGGGIRGEVVGFMGVLRGIRSRGTFILRRGGMAIGSLGSI